MRCVFLRRALFCAAVACAGSVSTAQAADLFVPQEEASPDSWTGFYIGGFGGGGAVNNGIDVFGGIFELDGVGGEGLTGGGFAGFNYQLSPRLVVGLQGDIGVADFHTETSLPFLGFNIDAEPGLTVSLSGRAGWLTSPDTLLYVIGGYSYAEYDAEVSFLGGTADFEEEYQGYHVGAGIETRLTERITGRIEYRYTRYDEEDWGTAGAVEVEPTTHAGILGVAYNFHIPQLDGETEVAPAAAYGAPDEAASWTGPYIGGFVGGGVVNNRIDVFSGIFDLDGVGGEGFVGGGFAGFNFQAAPQIVIGVQGDIGTADLETDVSLPFLGFAIDAAPELMVSVSGRAGWLANPDTLIYVIGGYSYAEYEAEVALFGGSATFEEEYDGFHIGGGIEARLTDSLSARVEYRYTEYGDEDWGTGGGVEVEPSIHTGTVGLAWHFGGLFADALGDR